jgi:uncharacterized membrane protein YraQ (UPF0718 family)/copper chaperone CopZ
MKEIFDLVNQMSPYILLGFLLAGVMHAFLPQNLYHRYLGGNSFRSVLNATLLGIPLPLCSCGVIPTAMSLRKEGASKGATVSFLIATPQTGIDSIIATYALMGLPFALIRPLAAFTTAIFGGYVTNKLTEEDEIVKQSHKSSTENKSKGWREKLKTAFRYAFVEMMQDIGRWLVVGLIIAGLITVFIPESFFASFADNSLLGMFLVLVCSIPMYLCATGSIPIAVALILKGLSPGAAFVLLMAGPAVNVASMLVIGKVMGRKTLLLYLLSIITGAILFGLGIDYLLPREWFLEPLSAIGSCDHESTSFFHIGCTIFLALLLLNALFHRYFKKEGCGCHGECCEDNCNDNDGSHDCHCGHGECSNECGEECHCKNHNHKTILLHIDGMKCNHCKNNIEKAVNDVTGVESAIADLPTGTLSVVGDFDEESVKKAITDLGFSIK